ncbi:SpoIIE family protein phosphatase [Lacibacterium aquatile]|uniref:SpoIIE family protein phosphatase n=1 Tax=Lacibacterium aquatile TaxID=1168082 RepID=A0ABW5DXS2_9PROT
MNLRDRLALGVVLLLLALGLGLHGTAYVRETALKDEAASLQLSAHERAFAAAVEKHDLTTRRLLDPELLKRPNLAQMLADRRFPELRVELTGLLDALSRKGITTIQVVDDQNRPVFAAPRLPGDQALLETQAATAALVSGREVGGVEATGDSFLQVSAVTLLHQDKVVGLLVVGRPMQPVLDDVAIRSGAGVVLTDLEGRARMSAGAGDPIALTQKARGLTRGTEEIHLGDQVHLLATLPLANAAGTRIGLQRWVVESTERRWASDRRRLTSYGADGLLLAGLVLFGLWGIRRAFRPLDSTLEALRGLAHGDTSVEIFGEDRRDEIGQTARALHVFRDSQLELSRAGDRRLRLRRRQLRFIRRQMEKLSETLDEGAKAELMDDMTKIEAQARAEQGHADSLDALAVAFRVMTERVSAQHASLVMMVMELRDAVAKQQQMESLKEQLAVVGRLQKALLPRSFPPRDDIEIRGELVQGAKMGGDFYDFFPLDGNRVAIFVGTVAGEGIPAAFLAVTARALVRASIGASAGPAACLARLSDQLLADNEQQLELQACLVVLDLKTGTLAAAISAFPMPFLSTRPGEAKLVNWPVSAPLATQQGVKIEQAVVELPGRCTLLFHSPGVARTLRGGKPLGMGGVGTILADGDDLGADAVAERALLRLTMGEVERADDASIVAMRYRGP